MTIEIPLLSLGFCEQAIAAGGDDPFLPAISISKHGSLAKWGGKIQCLEIRAHDPGLRRSRAALDELIARCNSHGVEPIMALPEFESVQLPPFSLPIDTEPAGYGGRGPRSGAVGTQRGAATAKGPVRGPSRRPRMTQINLVHHRPAWLAVPADLRDLRLVRELNPDDVLPIVEFARRHGIRNLVVPVTAPGQFVEGPVFEKFAEKLDRVLDAAWSELDGPPMIVSIRLGGIGLDGFQRLRQRVRRARGAGHDLGLALDTAAAVLEGFDPAEVYRRFRADIQLVTAHQVVPARSRWRDQWAARVTAANELLRAIRATADASDARQTSTGDRSRPSAATTGPVRAESPRPGGTATGSKPVRHPDRAPTDGRDRAGDRSPFDALRAAMHRFNSARENDETATGVFQNGKANFAPLIREIKLDLEQDRERRVVFYTSPDLRNLEFFSRFLLPESLPRL